MTHEWVSLTDVISPQTFRVEIVGVTVDGQESFSLSYLTVSRSITITPVSLEVYPGQTASYDISLTNFDDVQNTYTLSIEGFEQGWYTLSPTTLPIAPGETANSRLNVIPPVGAGAANYPFNVLASNILGGVSANLEVLTPPDNIPPATTLTISEPKYIDGGNIYLASNTPVILTAEDNPGGTGVYMTYYSIDTLDQWIEYTGSFNIPPSNLDGLHTIYYYSTDYVGNVESDKQLSVILDNAGPLISIETPFVDDALQDGVTLQASVSDSSGSGVDWVKFSIRELDGTTIDGFESMVATYNPSVGKWQIQSFDTTKLADGYYLAVVDASDKLGNIGHMEVPFSIRNWAVLKLLPATQSNKAGRTMPIKFSLRVAELVDPAKPFVWNEELTIKIYEKGHPEKILQKSTYGVTARDYRIDPIGELYITNFQTLKTATTYVVEISRKGMIIGSFEFKTVK